MRRVICPATDQRPRHSEGDIIQLKDGSLLLAWSEFYGGHGDGVAAQISAMISRDLGRTWEEPFVLQENIGECNVMSVSLLRTQNDELLHFFLIKNSWLDLRVAVRRSTDEGKTWSNVVEVSSKPGYNVMNNARVIQLSSGRILAPVAHSARATSEDISTVFCYISDDDGHTWYAGQDTGIPNVLCQEPGVVELLDGRVLMFIRTPLGHVYYAYSSDGGESWSAPRPSTLVSPLSPATIARIPKTKDLLAIWNNNPKGKDADWTERNPLTAAISVDEGLTWHKVKNLEESPDRAWAYTSIRFINDEVHLTYYDWENVPGIDHFQGTSLVYNIVPIEWFYS